MNPPVPNNSPAAVQSTHFWTPCLYRGGCICAYIMHQMRSKLLKEVVLETSSPTATEECLAGLLTIKGLSVLELRPKEFVLTREHMHLVSPNDPPFI